MRIIEYRVQYTGATGTPRSTMKTDALDRASDEIVCVHAVNINSGYTKALRVALEPLGNGDVREIGAIEFWRVVN